MCEGRVLPRKDTVPVTTRYDKILVTHGAALSRKYGRSGAARVRTALEALVDADARRGLVSRVLLLDNTTSMRAIKTGKVADGDWVGALKAVDHAVTRYQPSYIAIVGAGDVVPQCPVRNPFRGLGGDPDPYVPSDLPYACDFPDSWTGSADDRLEPAELLAVTRVVGRIPDLVGATNPSMLLTALATAATYTQRTARTYERAFVVSAAVWKGSTQQSVDLLPGPSPATELSPPEQSGWTKRELSPLVHFVNCHGGDTTPDWFGQARGGAVDTIALRPEDVDGRVREGTVVAAECCYGAMHMAPADLGGRLPMLWAYLRSGTYGAVGSSTTAYGPADGNGQADLICRYVIEGIVAGASCGRAMLDARQRFIRESGSMAPEDLKTLAQFDLLGDPSLAPVALAGRPAPAGPAPKAAAAEPQAALAQRRTVLAATGRALSAAVPRAGRLRRGPSHLSAADIVRDADIAPEHVVGDVRTFNEYAAGPRRGSRYHVAAVRTRGRSGFVVARETDGQRQTRTIWAR